MSIEPRLMTQQDARAYLRGLTPETIGVVPVPAKGRLVRYDRMEIDAVLNQLSSIVLDTKVHEQTAPQSGGVLEQMLGAHG